MMQRPEATVPSAVARPALERAVLEEAAGWLVRVREGALDAAESQALTQWLEVSEQHRRAWALAQEMAGRFDKVPPELALPVLRTRGRQRRQAVGALAALMAVGLGVVAVRRQPGWQSDYATATGERRSLVLEDGSLLELNTRTAVDIRFDAQQRLVWLHEGEILIQTGPDALAGGIHRPFRVGTPQGSVRALGTRFSVRLLDGDAVQVAVFEKAVEVEPVTAMTRPVRVEARQQTRWSQRQAEPVQPVADNLDAWTRGILAVVDMRMADFLEEIGRYHAGHISCDAAVADLRVTGSYRLDDVALSLQSLAGSHPVQVRFLSRYLVRVSSVA